jgi:hypothetical protein
MAVIVPPIMAPCGAILSISQRNMVHLILSRLVHMLQRKKRYRTVRMLFARLDQEYGLGRGTLFVGGKLTILMSIFVIQAVAPLREQNLRNQICVTKQRNISFFINKGEWLWIGMLFYKTCLLS